MSDPKSKSPRATVLIVDDHPAVREALTLRLSQAEDLAVCGEAADETAAVRRFDELKPDVTVVDISLKTGEGLDLIKRIRAKHPLARLLVWSMHSEALYAERALRAGALGYITKEQATVQIVEAIRQVLAGKVYLSPATTERLLGRVSGDGLDRSPVETLSDRELEVLRLIGGGVRTADIAGRLHLSVKTVETYRDRICQKLALADGTALAQFATRWVVENT